MKIESPFKIKTGYCLELLAPETMKLLASTENKITKDKICESVPHLLYLHSIVQCNIANNEYQEDSRVLYTFVPNNPFGSLLKIYPKISYLFKNTNFRISRN